jgi:hypothetical protein
MIGLAIVLIIGVGIGAYIKRDSPIIIEVRDKLKKLFKK